MRFPYPANSTPCTASAPPPTGDRLPVSPGRARNQLIPSGLGLYVVAGKGVSPLRDMKEREERSRGLLAAVGAGRLVDQLAVSFSIVKWVGMSGGPS